MAVVVLSLGLAACSGDAADVDEVADRPSQDAPVTAAPNPPDPVVRADAPPRLDADPARLADDLVADELLLRDPTAAALALTVAARRQQAAYRRIAATPALDGVVAPAIPADLADGYRRNVNAIRQLTALATPKDTLPAWRIQAPAPITELGAHYRAAEAEFGVGWNYLAAINFVETRFGRIVGDSSAGAQGPMQFMPGTWAAYGAGGDVYDPADAIRGTARYLAANNFAGNRDGAIFRYNNSDRYVAAINDYAAVLAANPNALGAYHRWEVYYRTSLGDVLLPVGYDQPTRMPAAEYLAAHPQ